MPFNISDFEQNIATHGISLSNRFNVDISLPNILTNFQQSNPSQYPFLTQFPKLVPFRASNVTTPGVSFMMNETFKLGVGPKIKQPYNAGFPDVKITFIGDSRNIIENTMYLWMDLIYNYSFDDNNPYSTFYTNYRDDTVSSGVVIHKYDRKGKKISTYTLADALPTTFSSQTLDWSSDNSLNLLNVSFSYTSYSIS